MAPIVSRNIKTTGNRAGPFPRHGGRHYDRTGTPRVEEFDAFVRARTHALLRSAYLLTGDQQLAEDLVQTALTRTHLAWRRLEDTGNAEAYARRTMYHLQVSWWRRRRVAETLPGLMPDRAGGDDPAGAVSLRLALRAALLRLSAKQRAVLVLRYFEDRTESETAEVLGVSTGTVKSQTSKALARLRAIAPDLADVDRTGALS
jgi:RNA polymerase sigma-70 factor (sigma-E family)